MAAAPERPGRLRARTLVTLRWMALAGQAVTLAVTAAWLRYPAPTPITAKQAR